MLYAFHYNFKKLENERNCSENEKTNQNWRGDTCKTYSIKKVYPEYTKNLLAQ